MANSYKILGQLNPTANTQGNVYVVPSSTAAVVSSIIIANQSTSNASYSIIVMPSANFSTSAANTFFVIRGGVAPASDTGTLNIGITLPAGAVLAANASSSSISISAFGVEVS
jgi:uncharacterized protein YaiE (UPF0345 family)